MVNSYLRTSKRFVASSGIEKFISSQIESERYVSEQIQKSWGDDNPSRVARSVMQRLDREGYIIIPRSEVKPQTSDAFIAMIAVILLTTIMSIVYVVYTVFF